MNEKFDLSQKENWNITNAKSIAKLLGYYCTRRFRRVLNNFILESITDATFTNYLSVIAQKHFSEIQPPLERRKK